MNPENRRQIIILAVVIVALGGALWYSMGSMPGGGSNPALAKKGKDAAKGESGIATFESVFQDVEVDIEELIQNIEPFEFIYDEVRIARNPAAPVLQNDEIDVIFPDSNGPAVGDESIVFVAEQKEVTGIIWDETAPLAVIDGEVVGEGHEFSLLDSDKTIVVSKIAEDLVVLSIPSEDMDVTKYLAESEEG